MLSGLRTDQALARIFPQHSRTRLQEWIRAGAATLDGTAARARDRVVGGERVSIHCEVEGDEVSAAQPGPLAVLHEDRDLLVLDKPPGLVVHPGAGNRDGTLLNRLLAHDPGLRAVPRAASYIRLDKDTSGLMLVARSLAAHTRLVAQIRAREVERVYEAVVAGAPPPRGTVEAPIGRDRARGAQEWHDADRGHPGGSCDLGRHQGALSGGGRLRPRDSHGPGCGGLRTHLRGACPQPRAQTSPASAAPPCWITGDEDGVSPPPAVRP